jgi:hypothetical protein
MICANFDLNWQSSSGEKVENVKVKHTDGQTDDGQQAIRKVHSSFQLRKVKKLILDHKIRHNYY